MIGDVLQRLRKIYGYKAVEMSENLGISKSYLSEIENNKKQPSLSLLGMYADIFEIKTSSLVMLSEQFDEAKSKNKTDDFIRKLMIKIIKFASEGLDDE